VKRSEAMAANLPRYFTGRPCRHGHVSERTTIDGHCLGCNQMRAPEKYKKEAVKARARIMEWRKANPEENRKRNRRSAQKHPGTGRDWEKSNRAKRRRQHSEWCKNHPIYVKVKGQRKRARKRQAEGSHTAADVRRILKMQRGKCAYCRRKLGPDFHVDHIVALAKGGSNYPSNIQLTCGFCNCSKRDADPIEYAASRGLLL